MLGMHRSGTSAVAGTLMKLGGAAPEHLMRGDEDNTRGYFESGVITAFHEELLASAGSEWRDWRPFNPGWYKSPVAGQFKQRAKGLLETEFDALLPVLKDPRACRFVPFWLDVLREMRRIPRIVMPVRSPLDVARSLSLRPRFKVSFTAGLLLWLRHVLDAEAHSRTEARSIFTWSDFHANWRIVCDKIAAETGLWWPRLSDRTAYEIDHFLAQDLVHHETNRAALRSHADVHEWALDTYDALMELARSPSSAPAFAALDRIRTLLDQSSRMFGRVLIDYEVDLDEVKGQAHALAHERDGLREERVRVETDLRARQQELASAAAALAELEQRRAAVEMERDALYEERARFEADLQARQRELGSAAETLAELEQRRAAAETERDALNDDQARFEADLQVQQQELVSMAAALAELEQRRAAAASDYSAAAAEAAELRGELTSLRQRIADLVDDRARLQAEAETVEAALREELARAFAVLSAERQRSAQHADQLAETLAEREALQRALGETTAISVEVRGRLDETERALTEARCDKERLTEAHVARLAEIDALRQNLAAVARERDEAQAAAAEARSEKHRLVTELATTTATLAAQRDQAAREKLDLVSEHDRLSSELLRVEKALAERMSAQALADAQALAAARERDEALAAVTEA
ncbi:MAG TPA: hypothetical protein VG271_09670, partial [Beijerinckiaceae bacterium]|nr:hypothetical protein [Beijerinckiaceae bacterium]